MYSTMPYKYSMGTDRLSVGIKVISYFRDVLKVGGKGSVMEGKVPLPGGTSLSGTREEMSTHCNVSSPALLLQLSLEPSIQSDHCFFQLVFIHPTHLSSPHTTSHPPPSPSHPTSDSLTLSPHCTPSHTIFHSLTPSCSTSHPLTQLTPSCSTSHLLTLSCSTSHPLKQPHTLLH